MTETESIPIADSSYSLGFKVVSILSGCFTTFVFLAFGTVVFCDDPLGNAERECYVVFCLLAYLFLQFSTASHQRHRLHTIRARVYFWLLASLPIWSLPTARGILETLYYLNKRV